MKNKIIHAKIKEIFSKSNFIPKTLIQGNDQFVYNLQQSTQREYVKSSTVLYEGTLNNKTTILKIIVEPKGNILRFRRELYAYQQLPTKFPFWKEAIPKLYYAGQSPLPFLIMERIDGQMLGDWYHLTNFSSNILAQLFDLLFKINQKIKLPNSIAFQPLLGISYYQQLNQGKKKSLQLFSQNEGKTIWNRYCELSQKINKFWPSLKKGLIFGDFSPSNIFYNNIEGFTFIDFETLSHGHIAQDLALFYFASLNNPQIRVIDRKIRSLFKSNEENRLLDFMIAHLILNQMFRFKNNQEMLFILNKELKTILG